MNTHTLEIIEEMNANPALVEELRALLLTREILKLPEKVASIDERLDRLVALGERHEETLAELVALGERHEETLAELVALGARHEETLAELVALGERHEETLAELVALTKRHDERLDGIDQRLNGIDERLDRLAALGERHEETLAELVALTKRHDERLDGIDVNLGWLKGEFFEMQWERKATSLLGSQGFRKLRIVPQSTLADLLDDLCDEGLLSEDDREDILNVDSVATAVKKVDATDIYIVSELSSRLHVHDVERVIRRASLLASATTKNCEKVVAGASIDDDALELANSSGVIVVTPREWSRKVA